MPEVTPEEAMPSSTRLVGLLDHFPDLQGLLDHFPEVEGYVIRLQSAGWSVPWGGLSWVTYHVAKPDEEPLTWMGYLDWQSDQSDRWTARRLNYARQVRGCGRGLRLAPVQGGVVTVTLHFGKMHLSVEPEPPSDWPPIRPRCRRTHREMVTPGVAQRVLRRQDWDSFTPSIAVKKCEDCEALE